MMVFSYKAMAPARVSSGNIMRCVLLSFLLCPLAAPAQQMKATIDTVVDGNTLDLHDEQGESYRIVLLGIDCPELSQPYGPEAKTFLASLLPSRDVVIHIYGKDRRKNYLAVVHSAKNGDVRLALLAEGLAWTSERDALPELETVRNRAVVGKKGLWRDASPVAPWVYRRQQSMMQAKSQ